MVEGMILIVGAGLCVLPSVGFFRVASRWEDTIRHEQGYDTEKRAFWCRVWGVGGIVVSALLLSAGVAFIVVGD